jgi:NADP-dependent 3-hydroxy acid dehydrogenase YdfG
MSLLFRPLNQPITHWQGRSVWLIGASSGIGLATAKALHAAGAKVVVSARKADLLQQFVDAHPGAQAVVLDVSDATAITQAAKYVQAQQGLDVVMYCAGYYLPVRASDYSLPEMLRHLDINYTGALRVLDAVLPELLPQQRGHISFISFAVYRKVWRTAPPRRHSSTWQRPCITTCRRTALV